MVHRFALCHQPRRQSAIHSDSVRPPQSPFGRRRHIDRLGDYCLDDGCCLETLSMGVASPDTVSRLGFTGNDPPVVDHLE